MLISSTEYKILLEDNQSDLETKRRKVITICRNLSKHKKNQSLSDDEFFHDGLVYSLAITLESLYSSLIYGIVDDVAFDNSCRSIAEILIIIELDKKGLLGAANKQMYRYQQPVISKNNFFGNQIIETHVDTPLNDVSSEYNKFMKCACEFHKCSKDNTKFKNKCSDPYFYLLNHLNINLDIKDIVKTYGMSNDPQIKSFLSDINFYSLGIHPHCSNCQTFIKRLIKAKIGRYKNTLIEAETAIGLDDYLDCNEDIKSVETIMNSEMFYSESIKIIQEETRPILSVLNNKFCIYTGSYLLDALGLLQDMLLCTAFGEYSVIIGKYKSFLEASAMLLFLIVNLKEKERKEATCCSFEYITMYNRFDDIFDENKSKTAKDYTREKIKEMYQLYYKNAYNVSFEKFFQASTKRILYLIDKDFTFTKLIESVLEYYNCDSQNELNSLYKYSQDLEHGSGFLFTHDDILTTLQSLYCVTYSLEMFRFILSIFQNALDSSEDQDIIKNISENLNNIEYFFNSYSNQTIIKVAIKNSKIN